MVQNTSSGTSRPRAGLFQTMVASMGGSAVGTIASHGINNFYSLQCMEGGTFTKAISTVRKGPTILFKGLPETVALRCFSQGGSIGIQTYLVKTLQMNAYLACAIGGIYDSCFCAVVDINNINKIMNKNQALRDSFKLFCKLVPLMATRDIPGLICGKIYGPKLSSWMTGKSEEDLNMGERMMGTFSMISLLQMYASPQTAVTTKIIQNNSLSYLQGFKIVLITERNQLPQRIFSRMILAAGRNAIALAVADEFLNKDHLNWAVPVTMNE